MRHIKMTYNNEKSLCDGIDQKTFFKIMKEKGYTTDILTVLFDEEHYETIDKFDFNVVIREVNKKYNVPIFDMLVYLEKNIAECRKVYTILDDRNKSILKEEAQKSFHIKISECSLMEFFGG